MAYERYQIPLPFIIHTAEKYHFVLKILIIELNKEMTVIVDSVMNSFATELDKLVKDCLQFHAKEAYSALVSYLFPAIQHESVTLGVVEDALCFSMLKQGIDGKFNKDLFRSMFTHAKNARSHAEFSYAIYPEQDEITVPMSQWTERDFDNFWSQMLEDD